MLFKVVQAASFIEVNVKSVSVAVLSDGRARVRLENMPNMLHLQMVIP